MLGGERQKMSQSQCGNHPPDSELPRLSSIPELNFDDMLKHFGGNSDHHFDDMLMVHVVT